MISALLHIRAAHTLLGHNSDSSILTLHLFLVQNNDRNISKYKIKNTLKNRISGAINNNKYFYFQPYLKWISCKCVENCCLTKAIQNESDHENQQPSFRDFLNYLVTSTIKYFLKTNIKYIIHSIIIL